MAITQNLEPKRVFHYFEEICGIPHGSGNVEGLSNYLVNFAKEKGLFYIQDKCGNVIMVKEKCGHLQSGDERCSSGDSAGTYGYGSGKETGGSH